MTARRILVLAQSFKETFGADAVGAAMARGVRAAGGRAEIVVGSDGGDGLLAALADVIQHTSYAEVRGPLGAQLSLPIGWMDPTTAVIESRLACGLALVPPDARDPRATSTAGVGDGIRAAAAAGATQVIVGLGGSATMDGGLGCAQALGWEFLDADGASVPGDGGHLSVVAHVRPRASELRILGLCDVRNPLLGEDGAVMYAGQKGASAAVADELAAGLGHLVAQLGHEAERVAARPGAGAAGGLGFGLAFFAGGDLVAGAPWVLARVGFEERLRAADAVVVGEGAFDETSLAGKLVGEGIRRAGAAGLPVALVAPSVRSAVPDGVVVETGGGLWTLEELAERTAAAVERTLG